MPDINLPMSPRDRLYQRHLELCSEALLLMTKKNHDYAGKAGDDPYFNFRRAELIGICTTEQGFLVRLTDKFSRLVTFTNDGELKVKDEGVKDTVLDIINYSILFYSFVLEKSGCNPCLTNSQKLTYSPNSTPPAGATPQSTEQKSSVSAPPTNTL